MQPPIVHIDKVEYTNHVELHRLFEVLEGVKEKLDHLIKHQHQIMSTQAELAAQLSEVAAQVEKAKAEITAKIADLETAIGNAGNTTPEVDAALAALKASVQGVDDIVPDAPTP